jgi:hypothetical protein
MWVLIVVAWFVPGNMGGGLTVSSVPNFTTKAACETAGTAVRTSREKYIQTLCEQQ